MEVLGATLASQGQKKPYIKLNNTILIDSFLPLSSTFFSPFFFPSFLFLFLFFFLLSPSFLSLILLFFVQKG